MAKKSKVLIIFLFIVLMIMPTSVTSSSSVWYASLLDEYFHSEVFLHDVKYSAYLSKDITNFDVSADKVNIGFGPALQVKGTVKLGKIPLSYKVLNRKYMLFLHAFLFSPNGKLLWEQRGSPKSNSWINANGDSVNFTLINKFAGSIDGTTLLIIAGGDPIISDKDVRAILGLKKITFKDG